MKAYDGEDCGEPGITSRDVTESINEEFHSLCHQVPIWSSLQPRVLAKTLPDGNPAPSAISMFGFAYQRIIVRHMAVVTWALGHDSMPTAGVYAPLVVLISPDDTQYVAMSFWALRDIPAIVTVAGRPPWHIPIEVCPVLRAHAPVEQSVGLQLGMVQARRNGKAG